MKKLSFFLIVFMVNNLSAQDLSQYKKEKIVFETDTLSYRILKPLNYNPDKQYPVHLFLHGAGERGNDNESQLVHGAKLFLKKENREQFMGLITTSCKVTKMYMDKLGVKESVQQGVAEEKCPHCNGPMFSEMIMNEKKDACYYKVKSRYKVWPSAYASGA